MRYEAQGVVHTWAARGRGGWHGARLYRGGWHGAGLYRAQVTSFKPKFNLKRREVIPMSPKMVSIDC